MDFVSNTAIDVSTLALDGLAARHKMLSANIVNAETPGYKRNDVSFEDQLTKIIGNEDQKEMIKVRNSLALAKPQNSLQLVANDQFLDNDSQSKSDRISTLTFAEEKKLNENSYQNFETVYTSDDATSIKEDGNNVNMESEMVELSKNGMKYNALATLQEKMFRGLQEVIKGGGI